MPIRARASARVCAPMQFCTIYFFLPYSKLSPRSAPLIVILYARVWYFSLKEERPQLLCCLSGEDVCHRRLPVLVTVVNNVVSPLRFAWEHSMTRFTFSDSAAIKCSYSYVYKFVGRLAWCGDDVWRLTDGLWNGQSVLEQYNVVNVPAMHKYLFKQWV